MHDSILIQNKKVYLLELGPNVYNKNKYISRSGFKRELSSCHRGRSPNGDSPDLTQGLFTASETQAPTLFQVHLFLHQHLSSSPEKSAQTPALMSTFQQQEGRDEKEGKSTQKISSIEISGGYHTKILPFLIGQISHMATLIATEGGKCSLYSG